MTRKTTYGLDLNCLQALLSLGAEENRRNRGQGLITPDPQVPIEELERPLSEVSGILASLTQELCRVQTQDPDGVNLQGHCLLELLLQPETPLDILLVIKTHGKQMSGDAIPENYRAMGIVLYYAAIAAARIFHGRTITQSGGAKLREAYESFLKKSWIPADLSPLFEQARDAFVQ
jgi:hypothetical protein